MPWIVDKNSGIGYGKITNRPGLVLRKNPGSEVQRQEPPSMPAYVSNIIGDLKSDIENISGIFDSVKGNSATGVYTAQGILALQEAGQSRIRLKVKMVEMGLGKMCTMWYNRINQFWGDDKIIYVTKSDGSYDVKTIQKEQIKHLNEIKISAGSTMSINRGAMLDLMIRLAQTMAEDGAPMVDRKAVLEYIPVEAKTAILNRNQQETMRIQELAQALEQNAQQDEQTMATLEQVVQAVEQMKQQYEQQIGQLQQGYDKMVTDEKDVANHKKSYNEGYGDAEGIMAQESPVPTVPNENVEEVPEEMMPEDDGEMPVDMDEELLAGIENLSDEELAVLLEKHPDLMEILQG
jgi:hypothetical protein